MTFDPTRCRPDVLDRFWSHVDRSGDCWLWTAAKNQYGYGFFKPYTKYQMLAHRFIDQALNGPHQDGELSLHKCDNPSCVRPSHLFRGTYSDNINDMYQKGRADRKGENNGNSKLKATDIQTIRQRYAHGDPVKEIARDYGLDISWTYQITGNKAWRE